MSAEREREYSELHAYLEAYATYIWKIDPESPSHPKNSEKEIVEKYGKSEALKGLKQAVNDTVEMLSGRGPAYIKRVDEILNECGVLTYSEVYRRYASKYRKILRRGIIKTETEYYLISGMLADLESSALPEERLQIASLIAAYEQAIQHNNQHRRARSQST